MKRKWLIAFSGISATLMPLVALSCTPETKKPEVNKEPEKQQTPPTETTLPNKDSSDKGGEEPDKTQQEQPKPTPGNDEPTNHQGESQTPPKTDDKPTVGSQETNNTEVNNGDSNNANNPGTTNDSNNLSTSQGVDFSKAETFAVIVNDARVEENNTALPGRLSIDFNLDKQVPEMANTTDDFVLVLGNGEQKNLNEMLNNHGSNQYSGYIDDLPAGQYKAIAIKWVSANKYLFFNNENRAEGKSFEITKKS